MASSHVLFDSDRRQINGIIDFGTAGIGDPAGDLSVAISEYGESLVAEMAGYEQMVDYLPRARFGAGTIELQWALAGLKGREPALAHLGGARDRLPLLSKVSVFASDESKG